MRRIAWIVLVTATAVGAFVLPEPESVGQPDFSAIVRPDVPAATGVWHCPLAEATFEKDTVLLVGAAEATSARFSFPNPVPGEESEEARLPVGGPGAAQLLVSDVALRGDAPAFIELNTQLGAGFSITAGAGDLTGDRCLGALQKAWYLPGGSTPEGRSVVLRLFNPFPETAIVTVLATSEFGDEPLPELQGLVVADRSWRDVEFESSLKFRDALGFVITQQEGQVLPAMVLVEDQDRATWPAVPLSSTWEFPVVRIGGLEPVLAVMNPAGTPATVTIDLLTVEGLVGDVRTVTVDGGTPMMIPLGDLTDGSMGIAVRAEAAVAAAVISSGSGGVAATVGAAEPARRWLIPGSIGDADDVASIWLMNSGPRDLTASLRPLGNPDAPLEKVSLPAGTVRQFFAADGAEGYLVETVEPISVAWSIQSPANNTAAFVAGVPAE